MGDGVIHVALLCSHHICRDTSPQRNVETRNPDRQRAGYSALPIDPGLIVRTTSDFFLKFSVRFVE